MGKKKRNKSKNPSDFAKTVSVTTSASPTTSGVGDKMAKSGQKMNFWGTKTFEWLALGIGSAIAFWVLTVRLTGVTVSVLIDEYVYLLDAHYKDFTESGYPNHLFQLIFSTTKACGPEFYECARSINAIFVLASGIVIYFLAKQVSGGRKWAGMAAWVATIFGSFGTYTAYFMPEAIFNFLMVAFFYTLVRYANSDNLFVWSGIGALLGLAALAKPHGLFVVPAVLIFVLLATCFRKSKFWFPALLKAGGFVLSLLAVKLGLGFLIAGENGFSLFGSYSYAVESGEAVAQTLNQNTWLNLPQTTWGQIIMIVMIMGLALPVAIVGLSQSLRNKQLYFRANKFRTLFALALLNMMAVSALFEAWQNLNTWMHTRYYSYLIPLAILALMEGYAQHKDVALKPVKVTLVSIFTLVSGIALVTTGVPYGANWIDAPDFKAHIDSFELSSLVIITSMALAIWWLWNNKNPLLYGSIVLVLASVYSGTHTSQFLTETFGKNDPYQRVGTLLRNYLPQEEVDKTVISGNEAVLMQRVLFYSLSGGASLVGGSPNELDESQLPADTKWLLAFGENFSTSLGVAHLTGPGYALFQVGGNVPLSPRASQLQQISNECPASDLENWVCGRETEVAVMGGFPPNAKVDLILEGSEGLELEIELGSSVGVVALGRGLTSLPLTFTNTDLASKLTIRAKQPADISDSGEGKFIRIVSINLD